MHSVQRLEPAFHTVLSKHRAEPSKGTAKQQEALRIITDREFWADLEKLTPLAEPFKYFSFALQD